MFSTARVKLSRIIYPAVECALKRRILEKLTWLHEYYSLSPKERQMRNTKKLYSTLVHAEKNIPYYSNLFKSVGFSPKEILTDINSFQKIPYLTKEIVREKRQQLCWKKPETRLFLRQTGGSTGPRTNFWYDQEGLDWTAATNLLSYEWAGHRLGQPEVHLSTRFQNATKLKSRCIEWSKCFTLNRTNIYTDCLDPLCLEEILDELKKKKPNLIQGAPSTFYALAVYLESLGRSGKNLLGAIESTGEKIDEHKLKKIQDVFKAPVYDRYGAAEFGVIAHDFWGDDTKRSMRVMEHLVWPETLPLGGKLHELVLTGLMNPAMPLIRYRMGDLARVENHSEGLALTHLEGRVHDSLLMNGKTYPSHYFLDIFTRLGNVVDFQLMVNDHNELTRVLIVSQTRAEHQQQMRETLQKWLNLDVPVDFCQLHELKKTGWRNKFRYIVHQPEAHAVTKANVRNGECFKTAIVSHSLAINGANNHIKELLRHFGADCDISIYSVSEGPMREVYEKLDAQVHIVTDAQNVDFRPYDLVLGNTLMTSHLLLRAHEQHVPTVMTIHENWRPEHLAQHINAFEFGSYISEDTVRRAVQNAHAVLLPATFQVELYRPMMQNGQNLRCVYCTIAFEEIKAYREKNSRAEARKKLGIPAEACVFLQVGTVTPRKNQQGTLAAFIAFRKRYPNIPAQLYLLGARHTRKGEHEYVKRLQKIIAQSGVSDCAFILETTPNPYPYYMAADILLHPSFNEVLPLAIIEAGAFHLPSIVSALDGLPEIIQDTVTGFLVQPNDTNMIVTYMYKLAIHPKLRGKIGTAAYNHVVNQHNTESFISGYKEIFYPTGSEDI